MTATSGQLRPRIRIYNLEGNTLCSAFSSDQSVQISACTLNSTGTFAMLLDGASESQTGQYSILLECLSASCQPASVFVPLVRR